VRTPFCVIPAAFVIPAQAGTRKSTDNWVSACAGMTELEIGKSIRECSSETLAQMRITNIEQGISKDDGTDSITSNFDISCSIFESRPWGVFDSFRVFVLRYRLVTPHFYWGRQIRCSVLPLQCLGFSKPVRHSALPFA
jgi:hypothetical protein